MYHEVSDRSSLLDAPKDTVHIFFEGKYDSDIFPGDLPPDAGFIDFNMFKHIIHPGSIQNGVTSVVLYYNGPQALSPNTFPDSLRLLVLRDPVHLIHPGVIPEGVEDLTFDSVRLSRGSIPNTVDDLTFRENLREGLTPDIIPSSVRRLTFVGGFDQFIPPGIIPDSVRILTFGSQFDQDILPDTIPDGVLEVYLGGFNREISPGMFPNTVSRIEFEKFNRRLVPGCFPGGVQCIRFGDEFNQEIPEGVLPDGVAMLSFGDKFDQILPPSSIPESVREIYLGEYYMMPISEDLSLRDIKIKIGRRLHQVNVVYEVVTRQTSHEDLIYKKIPESGERYLMCENKNEHVMDYEFMRGFKKTDNLHRMSCVYCTAKIVKNIYQQP